MTHQHADHTATDPQDPHGTDHSVHADVFRSLFWRNLILAVPVIATSGMVGGWFGYDLPVTAWVPPLIGTAIFVYGGWPFLTMAREEWKRTVAASPRGAMVPVWGPASP